MFSFGSAAKSISSSAVKSPPGKEENKSGAVPHFMISATNKSEKKTFGLKLNSVDDAAFSSENLRRPLTTRNKPTVELTEMEK